MFAFEGYTLDIMRCSLRLADREIALRPKSFDVLRYLVENADRVVTREELIKAVWTEVIVTDDSLTQCVTDARHALGDDRQTIIKTVPRRGYRFAAPVSRPAADGALGPLSALRENSVRRQVGRRYSNRAAALRPPLHRGAALRQSQR